MSLSRRGVLAMTIAVLMSGACGENPANDDGGGGGETEETKATLVLQGVAGSTYSPSEAGGVVYEITGGDIDTTATRTANANYPLVGFKKISSSPKAWRLLFLRTNEQAQEEQTQTDVYYFGKIVFSEDLEEQDITALVLRSCSCDNSEIDVTFTVSTRVDES